MNDAKILTKSDLRLVERLKAQVDDLATRCGLSGDRMPRVVKRRKVVRRTKKVAAKPATTRPVPRARTTDETEF